MDYQRIITRIKNMLLQPNQEWDAVRSESLTIKDIYTVYLVVVAAVPAICQFIGLTVVGTSMPAIGTIRIPVFGGLMQAVVGYVLSLAGVYVAAFIINKLAPSFKSHPDMVNAVKLAAFTILPVWAAGVLFIIPMLAALVLLVSLYAIYIFYLGLPKLMGTPADKVIPYMVVAAIVQFVVAVVIGMISAMFVRY
jgi:Yip1 domain